MSTGEDASEDAEHGTENSVGEGPLYSSCLRVLRDRLRYIPRPRVVSLT
jgi:hypothetical protein